MANVLSNGLGESAGDLLATCDPLILSGVVWWVDSATGTDGASPAGRSASAPLATLAQAVTNASSHDIIAFKSGHAETLTAAQTLSKSLTLVGLGSSGGLPTVKFTNNQAAANLFTVSGADVQLRNIWIEENAQACATARITVTGARFRMMGCYVQCGATDTGPAVSLGSGADSSDFVNTTFISTGTAIASRPESAVKNAAAVSGLRMYGVTFSDGTYGFSNPYALELSTAAVTRFEGENVSFLLGADANFHASQTGWLNPQTSTGSARFGGW